MGAQNTQNREIFNQNITKNVSKISKMYPKNGLKWCNIAEISGTLCVSFWNYTISKCRSIPV